MKKTLVWLSIILTTWLFGLSTMWVVAQEPDSTADRCLEELTPKQLRTIDTLQNFLMDNGGKFADIFADNEMLYDQAMGEWDYLIERIAFIKMCEEFELSYYDNAYDAVMDAVKSYIQTLKYMMEELKSIEAMQELKTYELPANAMISLQQLLIAGYADLSLIDVPFEEKQDHTIAIDLTMPGEAEGTINADLMIDGQYDMLQRIYNLSVKGDLVVDIHSLANEFSFLTFDIAMNISRDITMILHDETLYLTVNELSFDDENNSAMMLFGQNDMVQEMIAMIKWQTFEISVDANDEMSPFYASYGDNPFEFALGGQMTEIIELVRTQSLVDFYHYDAKDKIYYGIVGEAMCEMIALIGGEYSGEYIYEDCQEMRREMLTDTNNKGRIMLKEKSPGNYLLGVTTQFINDEWTKEDIHEDIWFLVKEDLVSRTKRGIQHMMIPLSDEGDDMVTYSRTEWMWVSFSQEDEEGFMSIVAQLAKDMVTANISFYSQRDEMMGDIAMTVKQKNATTNEMNIGVELKGEEWEEVIVDRMGEVTKHQIPSVVVSIPTNTMTLRQREEKMNELSGMNEYDDNYDY